MSKIKTVVFNGQENDFSIMVKEAGVPIDLESVTRFVLSVAGQDVDTDTAGSAIIWGNANGKQPGEIEFNLGGVSLPNGTHKDVHLIAYDPGHAGGQVLIHESLPNASAEITVYTL